ncbi:MAG: pyruvate kinase [Candidatus Heimdallarchaeota archaeon]|nr:pyruvate kinase [Candidatus Heimdallarchaeota archaeon]
MKNNINIATRNKYFARTKIICTLGPASDSTEIINKLISTGLDVIRLNFSHNSHEWHKKMFEKVRSISDEISILFDLQGPKIRIGELDEPHFLLQNDEVILTTEEIIGNKQRFSVSLKSLPTAIKKNNNIYINDGIVGLKVKKVEDTEIYCKVISSGEIRSKKGVNIPNVSLELPCLTKKDLIDLDFAIKLEPDYLALSFVRSPNDVGNLREIIKNNGQSIPIISKIEHAFAVRNFDKILQVSDAIMVARGDLGIETSVEKLPILQKEIIYKCNKAGKPVITATQMLESMITNSRPTRAEASDVANAIYDGTDAVMLSAETAIGKHPIESVEMMNKIALNVEKELNWQDFPGREIKSEDQISENLASAAGILVERMPVKAIIAFTEGGFSARLIAKHRPKTRIYVATPRLKVVRELGLIWGCYPLLVKQYQNTDQMVVESVDTAKKMKYLKNDDIIVVVSGSILSPGKTNLLRAYKVGDIPSPKEFNAIM